MHETTPEVGGGDAVVIGVDPHKASVTLEAHERNAMPHEPTAA